MGNRFSHAHAQVAEQPASIDDQIKVIVSELERFSAHRDRQVRERKWHPHTGADRLHQLRSVLLTLQNVKKQGQFYANREEAHA